MSFPPADPYLEYTQRLQARRAEAARLARLDIRIGNARLSLFLLGIGLAWFIFRSGFLSGWWLGVPLVGFGVLVFLHEGVRRKLRLALRSVGFYEQGIARLEDRWPGTGEPGTAFLDNHHPYAADLDLFGNGSVFELLCTARTRGGERTLADWLRTPASSEEIRARQVAIDELRPRLDLREELALRGTEVRATVDPAVLAAWGNRTSLPALRQTRVAAAVLATCSILTLVGWGASWIGPLPFLLIAVLEALFTLRLRAWSQSMIAAVERPAHDLALLAELLACLENERFTSPRLVMLRAMLKTDGVPPSNQIARLRRLVALLDSRRNQFFAPIAAVLLWTTQVTLALEAWRVASGPAGARWLDALGEFEALCALAGYAYEHPTDPFPEIVEHGSCFEGEGLGHPLIPDTRCVRNDVYLNNTLLLLVVSGSNMSGKSTLLRIVGTNTVLALAGGPVRARRLRLSPVAVGATLRIQDSLQAGSSRFYAEITRLRQIMDLTKGPLPVLFLFDELLHGTNSHDRHVGAEAIVRGFVERGAIGLITTHDLVLTHIADALAPKAANVCFEDHFTNGRIQFDYRMRPGVVRKSNALELMRSIGLEV